MALPVRRSSAWLARTDHFLAPFYSFGLRVIGLTAGGLALLAAGSTLLFPESASALLAGAGGLGALAFGTAQVNTQLRAREGSVRRARATARLARRGIVDRINSIHAKTLREWVSIVGTAASLDPIEKSLRELLDLSAPLGGPVAEAGEQALRAFHLGADHVNGLFLSLPKVSDFGPADIASKGRALGHWVRTADLLDLISPPTRDDLALSNTARQFATYTETHLAGLADKRQSA